MQDNQRCFKKASIFLADFKNNIHIRVVSIDIELLELYSLVYIRSHMVKSAASWSYRWSVEKTILAFHKSQTRFAHLVIIAQEGPLVKSVVGFVFSQLRFGIKKKIVGNAFF